jgi:DNA-binding MarR family transcriptional regulator
MTSPLTIVRTIAAQAAQHDLSSRQLAVFAEVYCTGELLSVKHLAERLGWRAKSPVTRALDRLCALSLVRRKIDPRDPRMIQVIKTDDGNRYVAVLEHAVGKALSAEPAAVPQKRAA